VVKQNSNLQKINLIPEAKINSKEIRVVKEFENINLGTLFNIYLLMLIIYFREYNMYFILIKWIGNCSGV
jgi:hypothetical protein